MGQLSRYSDGLRDGGPRFHSQQCKEIFLHFAASKPDLGLTQPPIQWVPGGISPGLKPLKREADPSPPSSAEFENGGPIPPLSHTRSWRGA
jgi:hypothetical protein